MVGCVGCAVIFGLIGCGGTPNSTTDTGAPAQPQTLVLPASPNPTERPELEDEDWVDPHLVTALSSGVTYLRVDAIAELEEVTPHTAVPILRDLIWDYDDRVRESAIEALGIMKTQDAAEALGALLTDPDNNIRETAVDALTDIGNNAARFYLQAAVNDPDPAVAEAAIDGLHELDSPK